MSAPEGPAQLVLTAAVARRHYLDRRTKVQIADELGLSRFKVARLLEAARASGMVRIEIGYPSGIDLELSARLRERYALRHAVVVEHDDADDPDRLLARVAAAAADLVQEITVPGDVLGLAWSRAVSATTSGLTRLPAVPVVQLTGALHLPAYDGRPAVPDSSVEIVRTAARVSGGPAYFFYAPFLLGDAAAARALRRQPEVARTMAKVADVTVALVGVGRWAPGLSTIHDVLEPREQRALRDRGVHAEVSGVLVDRDGTPLDTPLGRRMVGVDAEQVRAVPEVVAVAYGSGKESAVHAALAGGLVRSVVTHRSLARRLVPPG